MAMIRFLIGGIVAVAIFASAILQVPLGLSGIALYGTIVGLYAYGLMELFQNTHASGPSVIAGGVGVLFVLGHPAVNEFVFNEKFVITTIVAIIIFAVVQGSRKMISRSPA